MWTRDAAGHRASPGAGGTSLYQGVRTRAKGTERWKERDNFSKCLSPTPWTLLSPSLPSSAGNEPPVEAVAEAAMPCAGGKTLIQSCI